ncbi:Fic family protein [Cucumibacter marinus]|uniref:Fic family protein n=1 Tax=Cucumibacter marinus TaxID=1121252 RepID=UPI00048D942E|nr:Fic family protein [Cucumibacter marinus]
MEDDARDAAYFQGKALSAGHKLAGWAALVQRLNLKAPVRAPSCISAKHVSGSVRQDGDWHIYDKRYDAGDNVTDHLAFALRHESIDLLVLKRALDAVPGREIEQYVRAAPTGKTARRLWFFHELLTGRELQLEDAPNVTAVDALDPDHYFTSEPKLSQRHRVRDNLLGNAGFCPTVRKSDSILDYLKLDLGNKARETIGKIGASLTARAASFMLLADSRASFEIEGERPPQSRIERWGRAVLEAGKRPLNQTEIVRLHHVLIGDDRFTKIGYRQDGVFLGERDHNNDPIPEFIGARPGDLIDLMTAFNECNNRMRSADLDAVVQAAAIAFGFVYIHPLADGNGRLHRCLVHHVLAERGFTPPGMVFPVSSVMLEEIEEYRDTLQTQTSPLMPFIEWKATKDHNVEVTNDTADLYRFFDCTAEAEFLYECVRRTVEHDLPREIDYLQRHDAAMRRIMNEIEMPDRLAQSLIMFIRQNDFQLGRRRRENEFAKLTDAEVTIVETIVGEEFEGLEGATP